MYFFFFPILKKNLIHKHKKIDHFFMNDPYAGSPTKTLLRLLLPTNDKIQLISKYPLGSFQHSIGRSDGRCVPVLPKRHIKMSLFLGIACG